MIYLISKIVLSLLVALGIGFGMAWMLQMHLAARLREQLNSVIFETKSRIPQLESEITNRDQSIDQLREELAKKSTEDTNAKPQAGSKEQEKQIDELRQQVIDLENELRMTKGVVDNESVLELDGEERAHVEEPELMSDDEFLADIQDIFDDADESIEAFGSTDASDSAAAEQAASGPEQQSTEQPAEIQPSAAKKHQSLEEELQNELDGWDSEDGSSVGNDPADSVNPPTNSTGGTDGKARPPQRAGAVDLKAELLGLEDEIRGTAESRDTSSSQSSAGAPAGTSDAGELHEKVEQLTQARKELSDTVDSQAKEVAGLHQQRELQEKSLTVLNQQLELARMANERILRELRELKDTKNGPKGGKTHSATGG